MSQFANYGSIDPTLNAWAERNGLRWVTDYKGWDVRSYSWPLASDESVQIWVDEPEGNSVTVNVALNSRSNDRRRVKKWAGDFDNLGARLDDALVVARDWKNKASQNAQN